MQHYIVIGAQPLQDFANCSLYLLKKDITFFFFLFFHLYLDFHYHIYIIASVSRESIFFKKHTCMIYTSNYNLKIAVYLLLNEPKRISLK